MAANGNEVARLKQLRDIYPQVVSLTSGGSAKIKLGNGKVVTFSGQSGGTKKVSLLVRAMYNSFELLQGVSDNVDTSNIKVIANGSMKTFGMKRLGESTGKFYTISEKALNEISVQTKSLSFKITNKFVAFIGATIYVE